MTSERRERLERSEKPPEIKQGSLYQRIMLARFWLPATIVGVVLVHQLSIVPLGGPRWEFWSVLLFYSILGPFVTFLTLTWIASEVRQREAAQNEFQRLFIELKASHALLGQIQNVTEQFVSAPDLETSLSAASEGITRVTGALGAAIFLTTGGVSITQSYDLDEAFTIDAAKRDRRFSLGETLEATTTIDGNVYSVLTAPLTQLGRIGGSVHVYFSQTPSSEQRESFSILSAEFSAAAEAASSRMRDLLTLVEVDRSIKAEGNLERLLATLLERMMSRTDALVGGVYLADETRQLRLQVAKGLSQVHSYRPLSSDDGFVGEVASKAEPQIASHLDPVDRIGPILERAASAVALPLLSERELLGVVVLAHAHPMHFELKSLPFLNLVAGQVSLAVRNARAYLQSEELAIAEERARIAREIHDGIAQTLAFSALKLDLVSRLMTKDMVKAEHELKLTKDTLRETIKEVRRSIFALRPIELERHGFVETLKQYCQDYDQQNNIQVELDLRDIPQLSTKSEAVLFRIFQEAMHNVAKHARAEAVAINVGTTADQQAFVEIKDNGLGFDLTSVTGKVTSAGGLGLKQMQERIEALGGDFLIETQVGMGTRVFASIPS
ncbi:MAG: GAF domain-containing sensor histidine kinase [Trueperaceae bacterium]|nr:GAF domain-containing sensor histidine kinase [Trueperaceae bacterium]